MAEPTRSPEKKTDERAARDERLAKALRENLRRRKEQARAQKQLTGQHSKETGEPTA